MKLAYIFGAFMVLLAFAVAPAAAALGITQTIMVSQGGVDNLNLDQNQNSKGPLQFGVQTIVGAQTGFLNVGQAINSNTAKPVIVSQSIAFSQNGAFSTQILGNANSGSIAGQSIGANQFTGFSTQTATNQNTGIATQSIGVSQIGLFNTQSATNQNTGGATQSIGAFQSGVYNTQTTGNYNV